MSGVGGVSNVGGAQGSYEVTGGQLSTDSIMAYCSAQMDYLDAGIQEKMAQQKQSRDVQSLLGDVKVAMMKHQLGGDDWADKRDVMVKMKAAYDKMAPNDPMRAKLNDAYQNFVATAICSNNEGQAKTYNLAELGAKELGTDNPDGSHVQGQFEQWCATNNSNNGADLTELKTMADAIDSMATDCTKGAELQMINLQSMVSQRQMAVQLTTQIISKMNEAQMAVVGQIGK